MLAHRVLMTRPALYLPAQVRTITFARIALEPARKAAPPPPPPPSKKAASPAKKTAAAPAPKAAAKKTVAAAPAPTRARLTDREKAAREKEREREKAAKEKAREKEKAAKAKEREKEREKRERAREREKEKKEREKERAKLKAERAKALEKPYPPPPKRPTSGYFLFAHDPSVNRDRGEGVTEDSMKAGEAWKALTEAEREVYNKKSEKARAQWKDDVARWVASLNLAELTAARANREPGTRDESAMETLPKRPGNAYAMFLADVTGRPDFRTKVEALAQKQSGGDETKLRKSRIGLFGRTSAEMWKSMSEKEKAVYAAKSADAKKQWEKNYGSTLAAQKEAIISAHT